MGKNKKKQDKGPASKEMAAPVSAVPTAAPSAPSADAPKTGAEPDTALTSEPAVSAAAETQPPSPGLPPVPRKDRSPRMLSDLIKVAVALAVIAIAVAIWYEPPLIFASHPYVSYTFGGQTATDARLYRPLAMPTRYYIELPYQLMNRYTWFAVDRRREIVALSDEPHHTFWGRKAIRRSDPLGLDLEFRKLDHSEWQVHFLADTIIFSNSVLAVRLDIKSDKINSGK